MMGKSNFLKNNLSLVSKICLTAVFICLAIIFQKVVAINNVIPFLRISFGGPAIIIFSSIFLGPLYGLVVGVGSDLLGYFVLDPNPFLWQITLLYALLGFFPYFIFNLVNQIKNRKYFILIEIIASFVLITLSFILIFLVKENGINELWMKILLFSGVILLTFLFFFLQYIFKKKNVNCLVSISSISLSMFIIEITIMIICGTILKNWAFGFTNFFAIALCQILVGFVNITINISLITLFFKITKKYFKREDYEKENE